MNTSTYSNMFSTREHSSSLRGDDLKTIKAAALRCLGRREYSRLELFRKLSQRFSSTNSINTVLDQLRAEGYQSDDRFAESYIRSKVRAGNGPFKIKIELREKGVYERTSQAVFERMDINWFDVIAGVAEKRFGQIDSDKQCDDVANDSERYEESLRLMSKQIRYLQNKGFDQEHINHIFRF